MFSGKKILIAPLDWGLGHATRCVPLIRTLKQHNTVIIGTTPSNRHVFDEFTDLEKIEVPAYNISYSYFLPIWLKLLFAWPRISRVIRQEQKFTQKVIDSKAVDVLISDNRFGLWSSSIHTVFMTHQLFLAAPFGRTFANRINRRYIIRFREVWVPDYSALDKSLSGKLSHGVTFHPNIKYIGPLSRLPEIKDTIVYDYLFLFSGPEPHLSEIQKTMFRKALKNQDKTIAFITKSGFTSQGAVEVFNDPSADQIARLFAQSRTIVARSGYTSLMEFHLARKTDLILIPTPGQWEQEYLAEWWQENFGARVCLQKNLDGLVL
jgi:hypothetical protein